LEEYREYRERRRSVKKPIKLPQEWRFADLESITAITCSP
jgi:hypothetical protein